MRVDVLKTLTKSIVSSINTLLTKNGEIVNAVTEQINVSRSNKLFRYLKG